jgi:hypothetical protein
MALASCLRRKSVRVSSMIQALISLASHPLFAWTVLIGASVALGVGAYKAGDDVLWGDMVEDDE